MSRPAVSLAIIARDEEHHLPACVGPVRHLFAEVVVGDTGSADRTREAAVALGCRVIDVPWADDFAAARNAVLDRVSSPWAFHLDADDRVGPGDAARLAALFARLPADLTAYTVRYRSDPPPGGEATEHDVVRLAPVRPDVRWRYRAHEQIGLAVREAGGTVWSSGATVRHTGYADPAARRGKLERNLRLLALDAVDRSGDPIVAFYLGRTLLGLGRPAEAVDWLRRACRDAPAGLSVRPRGFADLVQAEAAAGRPDLALAACRAGRAAYPADAELAYREGVLLAAAGDRAGAEERFRFLVSGAAAGGDATAVPGWVARAALAAALGPDRDAEAERLWRDVLADRPGHIPALFGLGRLYAGSSRWGDLEGVLADLDRADPGGPDAAVLRAAWRVARGDVRGAAKVLQAAAGRHPADTRVWLELGRVLVLEGSDRAGAEAALRRVLAADPGNPDAARLLRIVTGRW